MMVSNLRIWQLAWPVILSNISIPLLGMVDIAVVGHHYPAQTLSAVAIGTMVFDVLFGLFMFLRMSTTGLVAQAPHQTIILQRALFTAIATACFIIVLKQPIFWIIERMVPINPVIHGLLQQYFELRIHATPLVFINYVFMGYFFGRQNTKAPLMMLLLMNCSGIVLDFILVRWFNMGIQGLAVANIMAQAMGCALGAYIMHQRYTGFATQNENLLNLSALIQFFHLNKDIFIRSLCLMLTIAAFTTFGAKLGPKVVAANAILMSMHQFSSYFLDGFAISCETLVGQAIGQKNNMQLIASIKVCACFSIGVGCGLSILFLCFGTQAIHLMTSLPTVTHIAKANLIWIVLLPIGSVASFLLDGIFIGATWSKPMRNTMIGATFGVFFPMCFLLKNQGNPGLWVAFLSFILARGIFLGRALYVKMQSFSDLTHK